MMEKNIRLLHIDDHLLFVQGIYSLLEGESNIQWLGGANTIADGLVMVDELRPDMVLLDYFLPDGTGIEVANKILNQNPKTMILMLTMENNPSVMEKCKEAGVMAFLPKSIDKDQLIKSIESAKLGESTFPVLLPKTSTENHDLKKFDILSKREKEIALLVAKGLTSRQISEILFLSLLTVKTHRRNLLQKLGMINTAQLATLVSKFD